MSKRRATVQVSVTIPARVRQRDFEDYVREAVSVWGGQRHPDDDFFILNIEKVTVKTIRRARGPKSRTIPYIWGEP